MTGMRDRLGFRVRFRAAVRIGLLCMLAAVGVETVAGANVGAAADDGAPAEAIYVAGTPGDATDSSLLALDRFTLLDSANDGAAVFALPADRSTEAVHEWFASANGSTVVAVEHPQATTDWLAPAEVTYTIFDGSSGAVRTRLHPPVWIQTPPLVSGDGTRLLVAGVAKPPSGHPNSCWGGSCVDAGWPFERRGPSPQQDPRERLRWYIVDTRDGRLVAAPPVRVVPVVGPWLDPTGRRLYVLSSSIDTPGSGVGAATIVSYDLETGTESGRVVLPELLLGLRIEGDQVADDLPGVALSPDGRVLAVVHPDLAAITLIDARRMAVERVVGVCQRQTVAHRALAWLGLLPAAVAAKETPGTRVSAVFAPDGRRLYVFGRTAADYDERHTLGLRVVDLTTGEVKADAAALADGEDPFALHPGLDGRSVYVERVADVDTVALLRLDASTLDLEAQRLFLGYRQVILVSNETAGRM